MSRNSTMRGGRAWLTAAAATAGLLPLAAPPAAAATGRPAPKWHIAASVTAGAGAFTAVVATGKAAGWAFGGQFAAGAAPTAWQLAAKMPLNGPAVTGIIALSDRSVYAIGNGNAEDEGGPTVVLHYNGSRWARVAAGSFGYGTTGDGAQQVSSDGRNGLWLPMPGVDGQKSYMVHYAAGRLTPAALPGNPRGIAVGSVSRVPGTRDQLAGGATFTAPGAFLGRAVETPRTAETPRVPPQVTCCEVSTRRGASTLIRGPGG